MSCPSLAWNDSSELQLAQVEVEVEVEDEDEDEVEVGVRVRVEEEDSKQSTYSWWLSLHTKRTNERWKDRVK